MTPRLLALGLVLTAFTGATLWGIHVHGYLGCFEALASTTAGVVVFVDLVIALTLALLWMQSDARERGLPLFPYAALTLAFGSVGPLSYLIHRELRARRHEQAPA